MAEKKNPFIILGKENKTSFFIIAAIAQCDGYEKVFIFIAQISGHKTNHQRKPPISSNFLKRIFCLKVPLYMSTFSPHACIFFKKIYLLDF